jgi:hypothetical protein
MEPYSCARLFACGDPAADRTRLLTPMSLPHTDRPPVHSYTAISPSLLPRSAVSATMQTDGSCDVVLGGRWNVCRLVLFVAVDVTVARRAFVAYRKLQDLKVPRSMDCKRTVSSDSWRPRPSRRCGGPCFT